MVLGDETTFKLLKESIFLMTETKQGLLTAAFILTKVSDSDLEHLRDICARATGMIVSEQLTREAAYDASSAADEREAR